MILNVDEKQGAINIKVITYYTFNYRLIAHFVRNFNMSESKCYVGTNTKIKGPSQIWVILTSPLKTAHNHLYCDSPIVSSKLKIWLLVAMQL